jgi:4-hydroxythreonine-4-phosphate dehydrogenase
MGDPGGIGPEISILSAKYFLEKKSNIKTLIFGSSEHIEFVLKKIIKAKFKINSIDFNSIDFKSDLNSSYKEDSINVIDCSSISYEGLIYGIENPRYAKDVEMFISKAVEFSLSRKISGFATSPINKDMMINGGATFPAHTELLAHLTSSKDFAMLFYSKRLITVLATIHIPLRMVAESITKKSLEKIIMISINSLQYDFGIKNPKIAVLGLNPHSGENGKIGAEDTNVISPVIEKLKKDNFLIDGPFPSDSFYAKKYKDYDIVVSMYHDQALIPFKLLSFNDGVNVTIGLPIIRTSPVHGTAYDIAGKNIADGRSMIASVKLACKISENRKKKIEKNGKKNHNKGCKTA